MITGALTKPVRKASVIIPPLGRGGADTEHTTAGRSPPDALMARQQWDRAALLATAPRRMPTNEAFKTLNSNGFFARLLGVSISAACTMYNKAGGFPPPPELHVLKIICDSTLLTEGGERVRGGSRGTAEACPKT